MATDLILVSAGYDAHREDPLASCSLDTEDFRSLAACVRALGDELGAPVGAVLEGGYDLAALAASVAATMEGLAEGREAPATEPGALVAAAAEQVGRYWPGVRAEG